MPKVIITIEGLPNGKTHVTVDPDITKIARMTIGKVTGAHAYALYIVKQLQERNKQEALAKKTGVFAESCLG